MKKMVRPLALFLFLWPICTIDLQGQSNIRAGVSAGMTTSQVAGDNLSGFDQLGATGGGFVTIPVSEKINGGFEILFTQKGSRKNPRPKKGDYTQYILRLNYIEVPVLLSYDLDHFLIEGGPGIGFLVSSREANASGEMPGQPPFEALELSFRFGGKVPINEQFFFRVLLDNSLIPVREHRGGVTAPNRLNQGQYNTVLHFSGGYTF